MDLDATFLLGFGAVVVVGGAIMYLVSLFSMSETSFEAVLEEQKRKKAKEDKERSQANKQKREQYKKNFYQKKKKTAAVGNGKVEKVDSGVSPMHEVQIKETPQLESGEPAPAPEPKKTPKTKAKKQQQEPAAQPKDESPKPGHPILKPAPEKPKQEAPVVQVAQTAAPAKAEPPRKKQESGRTRTVSFSDDVQDKPKSDGEQEKAKKKKKKEPEIESEIVIQLREAPLTDRDVQHILTLIKQKYGIDVGGGSKIKDLQHQLDTVKKELAESKNNLQQYVTRCMSAENKIEQLKQDLMVEKTKSTSLEKVVQEADSKRQQEVAMVQSRQAAEVKQLQDQVAKTADYEEVCKAVESLKTEKTYLVQEIQKNATVVAEKNRLSSDLQQLTQQYQESQRRCADLEAHQKQEGDKEKHYLHKINEQVSAFQKMQLSYSSVDSELKKVKSELMATQNNSTKLLEQVTSLQEDNEAKAEAQRALEQRIAESQKVVTERDSKIKDISKQNADLTSQVKNLEQQIAQLNSQVIKIENESKDKAAAASQSAEDAEMIGKLQSELESTKKEKTIFKEDVDRLKKKNNDLRERSWKAMDTLSNLEKALPEKVNAAKAEGEERYRGLQTFVEQSLKDAFPDLSVREESFEAWVRSFAIRASESSQSVQSIDEQSPELEEARVEVQKLRNSLQETSDVASGLKSRVSSLEDSIETIRQEKESIQTDSAKKQKELADALSDCERYKSVLNSTEEVLGDLQSSVEVEEGVWKKKVAEAHKEASKAHQDADDLRKTIEELKSEKAFLQSNVKEAEEMKKRLDEATTEVSELKEQLESAKAGLADGLQQTQDLNGKPSAISNGYEDELAKLKERLDKEKTLTKNLGQAATKLQTVLKQTQEQLNEEREKSADLEKKLETEN